MLRAEGLSFPGALGCETTAFRAIKVAKDFMGQQSTTSISSDAHGFRNREESGWVASTIRKKLNFAPCHGKHPWIFLMQYEKKQSILGCY